MTGVCEQRKSISDEKVSVLSVSKSGYYPYSYSVGEVDILPSTYGDYIIDYGLYTGRSYHAVSIEAKAYTKDGNIVSLYSRSGNETDSVKLSTWLSSKNLQISDVSWLWLQIYHEQDGGSGSYAKATVYGQPVSWSTSGDITVTENHVALDGKFIQASGTSGNSYTFNIYHESTYKDYLFTAETYRRQRDGDYHLVTAKIDAYLKDGTTTNLLEYNNTDIVVEHRLSHLCDHKGVNAKDIEYIQGYVWCNSDNGAGAFSKMKAYGIPK